MLILTRKANQSITIENLDDPDYPVEVRLGITAPAAPEVHRREVYDIRKQGKQT